MKRIENFRKGDRAEKLGVWLLQAFCAVAEVPRQEDFGLIDAVATVLRREHGCLYAEDSFLIQFKSRTENQVEYAGRRFEALLRQDLPLMIARVDLTQTAVELHTLGIALAHPNINDAQRVVAYLRPDESCVFSLVDDVLHVPLRKPILRWAAGDTESRAFRDQAYSVLKAWLNTERWNRRYRQAGLSRQVCWETNAVPTDGGETIMWTPSRGETALEEMTPVVRLLAFHAVEHSGLREPTRTIISWLREQQIEPDPDGFHGFSMLSRDYQDRLKSALASNTWADVAFAFSIVEVGNGYLTFWLFGRDKEGNGSGVRHSGSLQSLYGEGFKASVQVTGNEATVSTIGFLESWLSEHGFVDRIPSHTADQEPNQIILLQRAVAE